MPKGKSAHERVMRKRQKVYGPTGPNFIAFGKAVTAVLEAHYQCKLPHDIPSHVASLIYAQGKLLRMVMPFAYNGDSAVDAKAYIDIADSLDARKTSPSRRKKS